MVEDSGLIADAAAPAEVNAPAVATWSARTPDVPWCNEQCSATLGASVVDAMAVEPQLLSLRTTEWHVTGASVRGRAHGHRAEYREDAMACDERNGTIVLAVADGAGSSSHSRIGAAVAARVAVEQTLTRFAADRSDAALIARLGTAMSLAVHAAALQLHALATPCDVSPVALRTTLVLVAMHDDLMLVSQVGDGAVLVCTHSGDVMRIGAVREAAWAGEVTCFVPDPCAMIEAAALRQMRVSDVALIALMTDGVDDPFHPLSQTADALVAQWRNGGTAPIGSARQAYLGPLTDDPATFVRWLSFEQRGEVDDRTLMIARRAAEPAP